MRDIIDAIISEDNGSFLRLIAQGIELNHGYEDGITPLHYAAIYNRWGFVHNLIFAGADVSATTTDGSYTPWYLAELHESKETMRILEVYRAKTH